jgi:hypothetical protein
MLGSDFFLSVIFTRDYRLHSDSFYCFSVLCGLEKDMGTTGHSFQLELLSKYRKLWEIEVHGNY